MNSEEWLTDVQQRDFGGLKYRNNLKICLQIRWSLCNKHITMVVLLSLNEISVVNYSLS